MTLRATIALLSTLSLAACQQERVLFADDASDSDATADATSDATSDGAPDAPATCESATDCRGCDALQGCGWCSADNRCHRGSAAGPDGAACIPTAWHWDPATCPALGCDGALDCDQCMLRAGCGWCAGSNRCTAGTASGPSDATCGGSGWAWLANACPGGCAREPTCIGCQVRSGCGWCPALDACVASSPDGSQSADGRCTGGEWVPSNGTCLSGDENCRLWDTQSECTGNLMAVLAGCAWCASRGKAGRCLERAVATCEGDAWVVGDAGMSP